jgi:hypothetical protein
MKTFVVEPLKGIQGSVQFGMSREQARASLAPETADPFSRGATAFDGFYGSTIQVSYDSKERVEFIEFARGNRVLLDGYDLFGAEAESVIEHVKKKQELDAEDSEPGYSFCFPRIELGFWRPVLPEDGSEDGRYFESAGFGCAGYYSKKEANQTSEPTAPSGRGSP